MSFFIILSMYSIANHAQNCNFRKKLFIINYKFNVNYTFQTSDLPKTMIYSTPRISILFFLYKYISYFFTNTQSMAVNILHFQWLRKLVGRLCEV